MSRQPTRKTRQNRPPSIHHPPGAQQPTSTMAASDYESDAAHYLASRPRPPPPPSSLLNRTNTHLNLSVLRRYLPSITSILAISANSVVYTFSTEAQAWEKSSVEGTLFVCAQRGVDARGAGAGGGGGGGAGGGVGYEDWDGGDIVRACVFVLNRRGLDNVIVELARVADLEVTEDLLNVRLDGEGEEGPRVLGLWLHADESGSKRQTGELLLELWRRVRGGAERGGEAEQVEDVSVGPAMKAVGRKLSLTELFGRSG